MSINTIPPIGAANGLEILQAPMRNTVPLNEAPAMDFGQWMTEQLTQVNEQIGVAEQSLTRLATGEGNLHQVMLDLEKARTAFQVTLQVRNKLIEGYQEILRMQV